MSNLKDLTWEHHKEAERQGFVKVILSGKIHPDFYATYLWNQYKKYEMLEELCSEVGVLDNINEIRRAQRIYADFSELWKHTEDPVLTPAVHDYIGHISTIKGNIHKLISHIYVLHMGDLSGGQMIAKKVPGEGRMYKFDAEHDALKDLVRDKTSDDMADEAKICFDFATKLFQDLMEVDCERYLERTD